MLARVYNSAVPSLVLTRALGSVVPQLTKDRYPNVKRGNFVKLTEKDVDFFKRTLDQHGVITHKNECESYNIDWIKTVRGYSSCVLRPKSTEQVSAILKYCNERKIAVCPQGGNTSLVAGSVPVFDEVVLSMSLMNNILNIDETSGTVTCEAGCVLENLDFNLEKHHLMMPLDLGAKGTCQIGGNVSTNAGGLRLLRYGNLHGTILGIEAVLADGTIIDCLNVLKKDNTGYHLKHLFIGSEGTLGVVTKVAVSCPSKPRAVNLAFLGLNTFDDVLKTLKTAKTELGEILSSCELIDNLSLDLVTSHLKLRSALEEAYPFYMLIETHGSNVEHDEEKINKFLEKVMSENFVVNGTTTNELTKMKAIWDLRERITEGLLQDGYVFKYDISLPTDIFYTLVPIMEERLGQKATRVCGYGHIGDGNVHLNITVPEFTPEILGLIEPFIFEQTAKFKGSISAEHGIGFKKPKFMNYSKSPEAIVLMKTLKSVMDPNGILNPYKVLP